MTPIRTGTLDTANSRDHKREAKMIKMAEADVSYSDIGAAFGISRQRVHQILTRAGYDGRAEKLQRRYDRIAQKVIDAEGAISVAAAAKEAGVHEQTIHIRLIDKGYDSAKMRAAFLEHRRMRRLQGIGEGECTICGQTKPWGQFTKRKTKGVMHRVRRCIECERTRR